MVTPVPIPNTEVKRSCGDDSLNEAKVASRQNKIFDPENTSHGVFFCFSFICYNTHMSWAQKRRLIYISIIVLVFLLVVVLPTILRFYKAPTCFDKKQNQAELGVDCGGPCELLCDNQYAPLNVLWSRFFKVTDGVYNVLAYVENPNLNAGVTNLNYVFKLYDKKGVLLKERFGTTFVPANRVTAIFEPELLVGNLIPQRVEFIFLNQAVWLKQDSQENGLSVTQSVISREDTAPRLSAVLTNKTINQIKKIEAVGIVYNADSNTIAFSRTVIDSLDAKASTNINFNWPKPFSDKYARIEIVLRILK